MAVPRGELYFFIGLAVVVTAVFVTIQFRLWRSSKTLVGASRALALTSIILVVSDALAYLVARLAQEGWVPEVFFALAFLWFTIAIWPILVLAIVELILVLEMPLLRKCRTPVQMIHLGALAACGMWLMALEIIGRVSAKP